MPTKFAPDFANFAKSGHHGGGAEGIQARRSIKLELSFATHGFGVVRVVKAHNNFFCDAAPYFARNERSFRACMNVWA